DDQSKNVLRRQRYWAEKLVGHLFRYQSPQTSCAEISYIVIRNRLNDMRNDLFNVADKVWLKDGFKSGKDFELRHKWGLNKFRWVVNKRFEVKKTPLIGFEYDQKRRCDVSVGRQLYSFFSCLNFNKVIDAINHAAVFIRYAIDYIRDVCLMDAPESLGDLTSLIEFTISLVFSASPRLCDFCLPQSYLIKRYLKNRSMGQLVKTLINDLSETGCDSLVVIYYRGEGVSRFAELARDGAKMLKYNSSEEFRSSLWKIVSPVASERKAAAYAISSCNEVEDNQNKISEDNPESAEEIQAWFQKITDSPHADEKAKIIQHWFRSVLIRKQKSRKYVRDTTLDKIYNDISNFCNNVLHWEAATKLKGKSVVRKYIMLLKGDAVDLIVKLEKMQNEMDTIQNKLKKLIQSNTSGEKTIESCINLEDDLRFKHYDDVKFALDSLSTTENAVQHEKANIEWLENELQKTNCIINNVSKWIDECKTVTK
ncbi:5923_t:CDS:2, partial [Racocetra fulgida]